MRQAVVAVLVGGLALLGGSAATGQRAATVWVMVQTKCGSGQAQVGKACWDGAGRGDVSRFTVSDRQLVYKDPNYTTTHSYTLPGQVGASGAALQLETTVVNNPGSNASSLVCAYGSDGLSIKEKNPCAGTGRVDPGKTGQGSAKLTLVGADAAAGTTASVQISFDYGSTHLYFTYKATSGPARCKRPARLGRSEGCGGTVRFAIKQGGLPRSANSIYLDMTTNGVGRGTYDDELTNALPTVLKKVSGRVVRTVEYIDKNGPGVPEEYTLVFKIVAASFTGDASGESPRRLLLSLELVSSNDPFCPAARVRRAFFGATDGGGEKPDQVRLVASGCKHHSLTLTQAAPGKKPLVQVAIVVKSNARA